MTHLAEQYANEYFKDFYFNDPVSEADLRIIVQHAFQAGWQSRSDERTRLVTKLDICQMSLQECVKQNEEYEQALTKVHAMRDDDFKLIQSLQKQLDEALQTIEELRLKLSEFIVED